MRLIAEALRGQLISFPDFLTQMQGRQAAPIEEVPFTYFKPMHHSLRENTRLYNTIQFPPSPVLAVKFTPNGHKMVVSLHCGMVFVLCLESRKTHMVVLSFLHPDLIRLPTNEMMLVGGPCR